MTGRWRERWARLLGLGSARNADRELEEEFAAHLAHAARDHEERGLGPEAARQRAAAAFGSRLAAREAVGDQRSLPRLEALIADLRAALRGLRSAPGLALTALVTLGLGIGINVAVFTVANATLFKGYRGVPDQDRLVYLTTGPDCCVSSQDVRDWSAAPALSAIGAVADLRVAVQLGEGDSVETATTTEVLPGTFAVLRVAPALGRDFTTADAVPGAPAVTILSHDYWRARFGGDAAVIGRSIRVNGAPATVVGVMPEHFAFPQFQMLWMPWVDTPARRARNVRGFWFAVARLADGATIEQARTQAETIGERIRREHPDTNARIVPWVQPFRELFFGKSVVAAYGTLWGAVGLVLLVACANLANLFLARAAGRTRETAVRLALGAGRVRIVRQALLESLLLSAMGGVVGGVIATYAVRGYEALAAPPTQPWARQMLDYSIDVPVLAYLTAVATITGVLFGLLPALRQSSLDVHAALRDGGRGTAGARGRQRLTGALVVGQVAMAVMLLSAAGVLVRSFVIAQTRDLGFDPGHVVIALTTGRSPAGTSNLEAERASYIARLRSQIGALPTVEAIGFSDGVAGQGARRLPIETDDRPYDTAGDPVLGRLSVVGGEYFAALGVEAWAGRVLHAPDDVAADPVVVLNRRLATALWPNGDAVGRRLRLRPDARTPGPWRTVVGVVPDLRLGDPARTEIEPWIFQPMDGGPARGTWIVTRTSGAAAPLVDPIRRELQAADPTRPIWLGPYTMSQWMNGNIWRRGVYSGLFALFGGLGLLLAGLGLFAVVASSVAQRTQEIGVRVAIGASGRDVVRLVVGQALGPAALGLGLGLAGSMAANRLLGSQLVQISPADPATLAVVTAVLLGAAVLGCVIPARRALRVDPIVALRLD